MDLKALSDKQLLDKTKYWAKTEQASLINLLYHIREVNYRRLYSDLKYESIHEYMVEELGYSDPEAGRRISAMRLMRDVQGLDEKIKSGQLSLTNMCLAQTFFMKESKAGRLMTGEQKLAFMNRLANCSTRDANRIVNEASPEMRKARELSFDSITDDALLAKVKQLRGIVAHAHPNLTLYELMHMAFDGEIERRRQKPSVKHNGFSQNQGAPACANCGSTYALELDHIFPRAKGGSDSRENLRILCRSCNQRAAIKAFGMRKMARYVRDRVVEYGN